MTSQVLQILQGLEIPEHISYMIAATYDPETGGPFGDFAARVFGMNRRDPVSALIGGAIVFGLQDQNLARRVIPIALQLLRLRRPSSSTGSLPLPQGGAGGNQTGNNTGSQGGQQQCNPAERPDCPPNLFPICNEMTGYQWVCLDLQGL